MNANPQSLVAAKIGALWVTNVKDGSVSFGSEPEALRYPNEQHGYSHFGRESFPVGLLVHVRFVEVPEQGSH